MSEFDSARLKQVEKALVSAEQYIRTAENIIHGSRKAAKSFDKMLANNDVDESYLLVIEALNYLNKE